MTGRRIALVLLAAGALAAGLLPGASAAPTPRARTLIVAFHGNVNSMDPATACSTEDGKVTTNLYDRLVALGTTRLPNGNVKVVESEVLPRLASSWTVSADRRTYTFKIRRGVKFPGGREVDAEAVAFSLDRSNTMGQCAKFVLTAGLLDNFESIRALDKYTVEIKLKRADYLFFQAISTYAGGIVDPEVVKANGGVQPGRPNPWMNTNSAGSGPYTVERFAPGQEIVLVANKTYRGGEPFFERIIYKIIPDVATRVLLLERGDVDMAYQIPFRDMVRLRRNPNIQLIQNPGNTIVHVGLNVQMAPLDDKRVRQALALAVPYERIVSEVTFGFARQLRSVVPPTMAYYSGEFWTARYDLEAARRLLADAGHSRGVNLTLDIQAGTQEFEQVAVIMQSEFRRIGVNMQIRKLDLAKYYEILRAFQSQMHIIGRTAGVNDPAYFLSYMVPCGGRFHYEQYCNHAVDKLVEIGRLDPDENKRRIALTDLQRRHNEDSPWIFLYSEDYVMPMRSDISGFVYNPNKMDEFYTLKRR